MLDDPILMKNHGIEYKLSINTSHLSQSAKYYACQIKAFDSHSM